MIAAMLVYLGPDKALRSASFWTGAPRYGTASLRNLLQGVDTEQNFTERVNSFLASWKPTGSEETCVSLLCSLDDPEEHSPYRMIDNIRTLRVYRHYPDNFFDINTARLCIVNRSGAAVKIQGTRKLSSNASTVFSKDIYMPDGSVVDVIHGFVPKEDPLQDSFVQDLIRAGIYAGK